MLTQDTGLLTFNNLVLSSQPLSYYGHLLDVLNTFVLLYNLPHVVANLFDFVLWDMKEDFILFNFFNGLIFFAHTMKDSEVENNND